MSISHRILDPLFGVKPINAERSSPYLTNYNAHFAEVNFGRIMFIERKIRCFGTLTSKLQDSQVMYIYCLILMIIVR